MAQDNIIIGTQDAKAGDTLYTAFTKTEANFTENYTDIAAAEVNIATLQVDVDALEVEVDILNTNKLDSTIVVNQANLATTLGGVIDSTKVYVIDGIVDFTGTGLSIEVPATGISYKGTTFDISRIICSDVNYTLFVSAVGGAGNVLGIDCALEVTGTGSQVYNLTDATGFNAFEFTRINYNNCTSLGTITGYRQGFEAGTGRFGGTPELTLAGTWVGGYFIDSSIVRGLTDGAYTLYKAGAGFTMASRFRSNQNIDLPPLTSFFDFAPANFTNPSTVQIQTAIVTRGGVFNASDSNISPNMTASDLVSVWKNNTGMSNTFEGGEMLVATEAVTPIATAGVFVDLEAAVWTPSDLQHFATVLNTGVLIHLGNTPREYKAVVSFNIISTAGNVVTLRVTKYDSSTTSFVTVLEQSREVNNFVGGRDVAFFTINVKTELDQDDFIKLEVANITAANNVTAEVDSFYIVEER